MEIMGNIVQQTLYNKLNDDLNCAITSVGGDTSQVENMFDYAEIIKQQLTGKFDIQAGPGIEVKIIYPEVDENNCNCEECHHNCCHHDPCQCDCDYDCPPKPHKKPILYIGANAGAIITEDINLPNGEHLSADENVSIQTVFNKLFQDILINLNELESGSIIITDTVGQDTSNPEMVIHGLIPNNRYIRLNFTDNPTPLYINIQDIYDEAIKYSDSKNSSNIYIKDYKNNTGTGEESVSDGDTINEAIAKVEQRAIKNAEVSATVLNDINKQINNFISTEEINNLK